MALTQAFTITVDPDTGLILTLTDSSNWTSSGLTITDFVRQIVLKDALSNVLGTVIFSGSTLTANFTLAKGNQWIEASFTITGATSYGPLVQKYPFYRLFQNKYMVLLGQSCGCKAIGADLAAVDAYLDGALLAIPVGDGLAFQNYIDSAYSFANV